MSSIYRFFHVKSTMKEEQIHPVFFTSTAKTLVSIYQFKVNLYPISLNFAHPFTLYKVTKPNKFIKITMILFLELFYFSFLRNSIHQLQIDRR